MSIAGYQCFFTYFGLRENPFHVSPDPRFYYSTPSHDSAKNELLFGLQTQQGLLVLTGEAGTGKTTVLNTILESLEQQHFSTSYVFHSLLETTELFEFILRDFGVTYTSTRKGHLVRALYDWLISRTTTNDLPVLIIDEAQSLSLETLDELRLLLNLETPKGKLLQVILSGQSELDEKLRCPELRQLRQRVMFHCKLSVLSEDQTLSYVQSRLHAAGLTNAELFPVDTLHCIYKHSKGIPRLINLLCEHALITAYGEQQQSISPDIIQRIAVDFDLSSKPISVQSEYAPGTFGHLISFPLHEENDSEVLPRPIDSDPVKALIDAALLAAAAEIPKESGVHRTASAAALSSAQPSSPEFPLQVPNEGDVHRPAAAAAASLSAHAPAFADLPAFPKEGSVHRPAAAVTVPTLTHAPAISLAPQPQKPSLEAQFSTALSQRPEHRRELARPQPVRRSSSSFGDYWRSVGQSFVSEIRMIRASFAAPNPEPALTASPEDKPAPPRKLIQPIANWLRQPMANGGVPAQARPTRSATQK
ncbi:MAG TPA: AAA family ATPase [Candidatus Acidoferrum sp.]|jgi:type II secretory pathway predicted ATPase ExeA